MSKKTFYLPILLVFFVTIAASIFLLVKKSEGKGSLNLGARIKPVPLTAQLSDNKYYIWGASMCQSKQDGKYHLFYSRWEKRYGFSGWVTHSEIAHAVADKPLGPYKHVDVALPVRGKEYWDGLCTHNPNVKEFDGKYYLYYMGNTGDGVVTKSLNMTHRNNQRIGVAVADNPNGPWKRFDKPLINVGESDDDHDALMTSNPSVCRKPDGDYLIVYKCVGKKNQMPFGGPVVHMAATSKSPVGPFKKYPNPIFTSKDNSFFPAEDPFIWTQKGKLWALIKDFKGVFSKQGSGTVLFTSKDGTDWEVAKHAFVMGKAIEWEKKGLIPYRRVERPQLWLNKKGRPKVLFFAVQNGGKTFNVHVPLR